MPYLDVGCNPLQRNMEIDELKEQTKNWLDSRLKNPYFGAVVAVWLITNRVLVFSLFNFDEDFKLLDRIDFIHNHLQSFNQWGLKGFWGTIIWSFGWGFVAMVVLDIINGIGKSLFKFAHRLTNWMLSKVEPSKWKEIEDFYKLEKEKNDVEEELKLKKVEAKRYEKDYEDAVRSLNEAIKEKEEKENQIKTNAQTLNVMQE